MTYKTIKRLELCLSDGHLVNRAWIEERGFIRPRADYALRPGKLGVLCHGIYRYPGYPAHEDGGSARELQELLHNLLRGGMQRIGQKSTGKIVISTSRKKE